VEQSFCRQTASPQARLRTAAKVLSHCRHDSGGAVAALDHPAQGPAIDVSVVEIKRASAGIAADTAREAAKKARAARVTPEVGARS
jgi:hypothetical protein